MALRPLNPAVTESLAQGWDLVASEGGRSSKGLRASVTLFNGTAQPAGRWRWAMLPSSRPWPPLSRALWV